MGSAQRWWSVRLLPAHLIGLVCVGIAVAMGYWQYDAYQERRATEQRDLTSAPEVAMTELLGPDDPFPSAGLGRPVTVTGTWLPDATVLVDERAGTDGEEGRWVVTPLTVGGADAPAVPVVRGWVPSGTTLDDLAASGAAPSGEAEVTGWLQPPESAGEPDPDPTDDVLPRLRTADLVQRVDQDLYGAYVVARDPAPADAAAGVEAASLDQLPEVSRFTGLRNLLYAVEWWFFGSFAAFLWWRHVRDTTREVDLDEAGAGPGPEDDVRSTA